jgi:AraC-like DNA-binding protein
MQALHNNYLTLKLVRLDHSEEWKDAGEGLSFILLKGGKGIYVLREKTRDLLPGDVMVLNPAAGGKLLAQNGAVVFWWFSVCCEHLFPLFSAGEICLLQNITENFKESKLYSASSPLAQECHRLVERAPPEGNVDHRSQMLRIAAAVLSVEFLNARGHQSGFVRAEDHAIQVFESLSADELLMLSVGELAIRFSCSRRHLNRLFHQHFGVSVGRLKMEMRLLKAISLLRDPDAKIINVAGQCGFNHLGLFNTCFKRRFNSSPGQWRKIALQNPEKAASAFNAGLLSNEPSNQVSSPAIHADSSSLIKAKVYQFLKEAYPAGATNDTEGDRAGKQGRAARAPKTRLSGQDFRSPPMD